MHVPRRQFLALWPMTTFPTLFIGCTGWTISQQHASSFPASGSHLERYAQRFTAVEINSSFYRPHRRTTYERWAASVPPGFAFAVKAPQEMTHQLRLASAAELIVFRVRLVPFLFQAYLMANTR
jgi:uncharacterized protein YecE (DUF72 family)